jgi:hypothetical protein
VIAVESHVASSVLRIRELPVGKGGVPHLNWRITGASIAARPSTRAAFHGPCIYAIAHRRALVYLGSYLGAGNVRGHPKKACFAGDIVNVRWWAHVGTLTGRSHRLSIGQVALRALAAIHVAEHSMVAALALGDGDELAAKKGCDCATERLLWAAQNWTRFSAPSSVDEVLSEFELASVRLTEVPAGQDAYSLAGAILKVEDALIAELDPPANDVRLRTGDGARRIASSDALNCIEVRLRAALASD